MKGETWKHTLETTISLHLPRAICSSRAIQTTGSRMIDHLVVKKIQRTVSWELIKNRFIVLFCSPSGRSLDIQYSRYLWFELQYDHQCEYQKINIFASFIIVFSLKVIVLRIITMSKVSHVSQMSPTVIYLTERFVSSQRSTQPLQVFKMNVSIVPISHLFQCIIIKHFRTIFTLVGLLQRYFRFRIHGFAFLQ